MPGSFICGRLPECSDKLYINNVQKNLLQRFDSNTDGSAGAATTLQTACASGLEKPC